MTCSVEASDSPNFFRERRCRDCGGSGRQNWQEPEAAKIDCIPCRGKGWIEMSPNYCRKCTPAGLGSCRCEIACNE